MGEWTGELLFEAKIDDLAPGLIGKDAYFNTKHHMRIEVRGKEITTFLNGTQIDKRTNEHAAYGKIGFRHTTVANDCDEQAAYDNIVIKDMDTDATLFEDCFDDPSNPNFGFGEIRNGELYVVNVLQLQKDKTNSAPMYRKEFQADKEIKKPRFTPQHWESMRWRLTGKRSATTYLTRAGQTMS